MLKLLTVDVALSLLLLDLLALGRTGGVGGAGGVRGGLLSPVLPPVLSDPLLDCKKINLIFFTSLCHSNQNYYYNLV